MSRLRHRIGLPEVRRHAVPDAPARTTGRNLRARFRHGAAPLVRPLLDRLANLVAAPLAARLSDRFAADTVALRARVESLALEVDSVAYLARPAVALADLAGLAQDARPLSDRLAALTTNLELMKGELRTFGDLLDELGFAIAPGAGLVGVPARFGELRDRVNAIDRRLRLLSADVEGGIAHEPRAAGGTGRAAVGGSGFDYVGFELRFRGDRNSIAQTMRDRYFDVLVRHPPVLDVGCGRGELLAILATEGVAGEGIDLDSAMVSEARAEGIEAHVGDAVAFLRSRPEASYGAITAIQVVEHLELDALVELLELAATRLRPGGLFIAETPNPTSLIVLGNSYILDPTHVWPLHPSLLTFLCERAGFTAVRLRFFDPARDYHLPLIAEQAGDPEYVATLNDALRRLNDVLFGPQDYAVVASVAG